MSVTDPTQETRETAAKKIMESARVCSNPPRKLFLRGYSQKEIAKMLPASSTLYGGQNAGSFFPQATTESRPGFYKNDNSRLLDEEVDASPVPAEASKADKERLAINIIELMTENQKLSKTNALKLLDEICPGHGLEKENKSVVIAALTKAQIEQAE